MSKFLILGGSDAGISAALRARELDSTWEVTGYVSQLQHLWSAILSQR